MGGQIHSNPPAEERNEEQLGNREEVATSNETAPVTTGAEEVEVKEEATPPETTAPVEENAEVAAEEATATTEQ